MLRRKRPIGCAGKWGTPKITVGILVAVVFLGGTVPGARAEVTQDKVQQAIHRARNFLLEKQHRQDGHWPPFPGFAGGETALCTLALLNAGDKPNEPHMARALAFLRSMEPPKFTYVAALQSMVFCQATPEQDRLLIRRNVALLESWQIKKGIRNGGWTYSAKQSLNSGDNSNSQFALLALHEAERAGIEVSRKTWELAHDYWVRMQYPDGSWGYDEANPGTGSMTCAGISSLVIASGHFTNDASVSAGGRVLCCGRVDDTESEQRIRRGLQWLGKNFSIHRNPVSVDRANAGRAWVFYYLYGVERVGRLSGRRFIGRHDWYREGAEALTASQDSLRGFWRGIGGAESDRTIATALALLFIAKGQRPVLAAKLKYGDDDDWNRHRSDLANLTRYAEQAWGRDMTWQVIDIRAASAVDLRQAPVLFLSGRDTLRLTDDQRQELRSYIDQGGFVLAEACCNGEGFDRDFRRTMQQIFPNNPLRELPHEHPVWYAEAKVDPEFAPQKLWGIDACCRTSVVYCPEDLSCYWELGHEQRARDYPEAVEKKITACLNLGVNVLAYATGRQLKNKLDAVRATDRHATESSDSRGVLVVPKLRHGGGSDDAPLALSNLLDALGRELNFPVSRRKLLLAATDPALFDYPLVFMHGRREFRLSSDERNALGVFLERGGVILADSICASQEFSDSFRREMQDLLPGGIWQPVPPKHVMLTREFGGFDLARVTRRDPQFRMDNDSLRAQLVSSSPRLEGLLIDDRYAAIFSPYDLSCALENTPSLECQGYVPEDAARIGMNLVLYALQQ